MEVTQNDVEEYLRHCERESRLSRHTVRAYRIDLRQLLGWLRRKDNAELDEATIKGYLAHLNARYAASSAKRKIASARAFAAYLSHERKTGSPFAGARIGIREPQRLPRTIALGDLARMLEPGAELQVGKSTLSRFLGLRDQAILEVLIATGVRVSELCLLDVEDCDMEGRQAWISGKGSKERVVQLEGEDTLRALGAYLEARDEWTAQRPGALPEGARGAVFLNRFGGRMSEQAVRAVVSRRARRAGVATHVTPHMFRHTFATMLLEDDVNLRYIQSLLGHSSVKTTERYTHVAHAKQREVLRRHNPRDAVRAAKI